jgi:CO/xanthine dehydrogenase FAD-binding subunit
LKWIDYAKPASVDEAVGLLAGRDGDARVLAGGTDILVQLRVGRRRPALLVDVKEITELNQISYDPAKGLTLGAAVPCYKVYGNTDVAAAYPGLTDSASLIGGIQIQGRASIGGNLCNAAPSADAVPILIALGATCQIAGPTGTRSVAVEEFCTGPGQNLLQSGEVLVSLHLPPPLPHAGARYIRFIPRNEMDIAVVGTGVSVVLDDDNRTFKSARIALASVAPTPLYCKEAGDALVGQPVSAESIQQAAEMARAAATPITDMRGTTEYRSHLCAVLTRRALNTAVERASQEGG